MITPVHLCLSPKPKPYSKKELFINSTSKSSNFSTIMSTTTKQELSINYNSIDKTKLPLKNFSSIITQTNESYSSPKSKILLTESDSKFINVKNELLQFKPILSKIDNQVNKLQMKSHLNSFYTGISFADSNKNERNKIKEDFNIFKIKTTQTKLIKEEHQKVSNCNSYSNNDFSTNKLKLFSLINKKPELCLSPFIYENTFIKYNQLISIKNNNTSEANSYEFNQNRKGFVKLKI